MREFYSEQVLCCISLWNLCAQVISVLRNKATQVTKLLKGYLGYQAQITNLYQFRRKVGKGLCEVSLSYDFLATQRSDKLHVCTLEKCVGYQHLHKTYKNKSLSLFNAVAHHSNKLQRYSTCNLGYIRLRSERWLVPKINIFRYTFS